jgi:hypothetical protein
MATENTTTEPTPMEKNLSYLEKQLEFLGFGEDAKILFLAELEKNRKNEKFDVTYNHSFATPLTKKDNPATRTPVVYTFHYNKDKDQTKENRFFFLNSYDISNGKNAMKMYVSSDKKNFTMKEAFNLLEERAVYKRELIKQDGNKYNAWVNFDVKHRNEKNQPAINRYTDNYGFNVSAELKKIPLKENQFSDRHHQLIDSLEKGNLQGVTAIVDGKEKQLFIEANPQFKNFNLYEVNDKNKLVPVRIETSKVQEQSTENKENETQKIESKNNEKQEPNHSDNEQKQADNKAVEKQEQEIKTRRKR